MAAASFGFIFLYKTTTSDPGFLPMGYDSYSKREGTPDIREKTQSSDSSKHHLLGVYCCMSA